MHIPINIPEVRERIRSVGLSYQQIAIRSNGGLRKFDLNNVLNRVTKGLSYVKLEALSRVLECDPEELIEPDYLRLSNTPVDVAVKFQDLYQPSRTELYTFYHDFFQRLLKSENFVRLMSAQAEVFLVLTSTEESVPVETTLGQALEAISRREREGVGATSVDLSIGREQRDWLVSEIDRWEKHTLSQRAMLLFCYSVCLFDTFFVYELVASGLQTSMNRQTAKLTQFHELSIGSERLKARLVNYLANQRAQTSDQSFVSLGLAERVLDDTILAICACERCRQHLQADSMACEQVRRPALSSIISRLSKTADDLGIPATVPAPIDHVTSRFGRLLELFRAERKRFRDEEREAIRQAAHEREMQTRQQKADIEARQRIDAFHYQVNMKWQDAYVQAYLQANRSTK